MSTSLYLSCLWPGLPGIWWRGRLSSLPLAVGFAVALNLFLILGWIYPNWFSGGLFWLGTLVAIAVWLFYVVQGLRGLSELINPRTVSDEPDRFMQAHMAYLQADWEQAEKLLTGVLAIEPRDPPALILLCSVYRHQARLDAAKVLLDEIGRLEVADAWWIEIAAERRRLRRAEAAQREGNDRSKQEPGTKTDCKTASETRNEAKNSNSTENRSAADMTASRSAAA